MNVTIAAVSLLLLCFSFAAALGGGFYEHVVLTPLWQKSRAVGHSVVRVSLDRTLQLAAIIVSA